MVGSILLTVTSRCGDRLVTTVTSWAPVTVTRKDPRPHPAAPQPPCVLSRWLGECKGERTSHQTCFYIRFYFAHCDPFHAYVGDRGSPAQCCSSLAAIGRDHWKVNLLSADRVASTQTDRAFRAHRWETEGCLARPLPRVLVFPLQTGQFRSSG